MQQNWPSYKVQKLELVKKLEKGKMLCVICLNRNPGKNIFVKIRRGTC